MYIFQQFYIKMNARVKINWNISFKKHNLAKALTFSKTAKRVNKAYLTK